MQREEDEDTPRSRASSRRNSASLSRRSSLQKEREGKKKSPLNTAPSSVNTTPKKTKVDLCVTGKPLLKKSDRANSLPGYQRRPSIESTKRRPSEAVKKPPPADSRDASLEDDALDLSQVSDFEDTNAKYGVKKCSPIATSTPRMTPRPHKGRSTSLHSQLHLHKLETSRKALKMDSRQSNSSLCSRDSLYKTSSSSNYRYGISTELDYSSVSPEYSGQSSTDLSPRVVMRDAELVLSPRSQDFQVSSCLVSTWQEASDGEPTRGEECGEWSHFWDTYNTTLAAVPMKSYYDQCPTPYRTETFDLNDLDFSAEGSRKRSPDMRNLNSIIRNEGLHLTPRETQNIIKCAHILGNVLTKAIERRSKEKDCAEPVLETVETVFEEKDVIKKNLTLDLKETVIPLEVKEEKKSEMTQTDISLPNTRSAPKIFEKILRQLSKTSLEDSLEKKPVEKEPCDESSVKKNDVGNCNK